MSQAEELLNSLYGDEASTRTIEPSTESHIVVNADRTITVPDELKHIAVQFDHNIETVTFDCPRYWDEHDFSKMKVYIVYRRHDGYVDRYPAKNLRVDDTVADMIHFDWTISKNVTLVKGNISFIVCINTTNDEGVETNHWNSRLNQDLIVDEGLECSNDEIVEQNPDVIENILTRLNTLEQGNVPFIENAFAGGYVYVAGVDDNGNPTAWGVSAISFNGNSSTPEMEIEPTEDDIPKVFFGNALPQTKDDTVMSFRYISKTADISGYCKTKAQGNSSMSYPKKNQTVKLYKDAECTEKLKVGFKDWGKQNKFCFKANWVDLTHARNIVSARLWGDVVKSRANYAELPELLRTSPNQGAVDGFPVKVYADGIYQGRYTLNIPKDAWMANMDDELDTHCILCGENYVSGCFRAEANIDESDWTDEVHDTVPDSIKTRWNEAIRFVMNSTDEEFKSGVGNYFDVDSLIDYYLFGVIVCNNDGFGKNQLFFTYDGLKWIASVYDVDNTFGTYLGYVLAHDFPRNRYEDYYASYETRYGNLLYIRLESLFADAIKARYAELKNGALSLTNIINRFERFTDIAPQSLIEEDYADTTANGAFTEIPLQAESNIQQIRNYIAKRYTYVDEYILNLGENGNLLYSLPGETTFDGATTIDTGVKLFDEPKSFTIIADLPSPTEATRSRRVLSCAATGPAEDDWPYLGGVELRVYPWDDDTAWSVTGDPGNGDVTVFRISSEERTKLAIVFENGSPSIAYSRRASDSGVITHTPQATYTAAHNSNLVIGSNNNGGDYYDGTVYSLEVWDYAMTAEEIAEKLA